LEKNYKFWDPFCGSGTIVIELLMKLYGLGSREGLEQYYHLLQIPVFG